MTTIIQRGRLGGVPSIVTLGVTASLALSACTVAAPESTANGSTAAGGAPPAQATTQPNSTTTPEPGSSPDPSGSPTSDTPSGSPTADTQATASAAPAADTSDDDESQAAPPFYANTLPDFGDAAGGTVGVLSAIRAGRQDGFDRVVFEFGDAGTPGWHVRYVDAVIGDPSALELDVEGAAVLEVTLTPVPYPDGDPDAYSGAGRVQLPGAESVTEVLFHSIFEGYLQAFVGVRPGEVPFAAYELTNPARIVIDVQHPA